MASTAQSPHAQRSDAAAGPQLDNRRIAAAAIDLVAPALALLALMAGGLLTPAVALVLVGWTLFYFFALESGDGQTLGKRAMRLRVVSTDGRRPTMRQYASRNLVRLVDLPAVGLIAMIASGDTRQRLGDRAAQTMVVDAGLTPDAADPTAEAMGMRAAPSVPDPAAKAKRSRPSLGGPEIRLPKLPRLSRPKRTVPVSASIPEPESAPQVKPFDPFAEDAPSPTIEVVPPGEQLGLGADVALPEAALPEPELPDDTEVPDVQVVRPAPDFAPPPRRNPGIPAIPPIPDPDPGEPLLPAASAAVSEEPPPESPPPSEPPPVPEAPVELPGAIREDGSSRLNVKPIETVSPLELLMQEAEEHGRPGGDSSL